MYIPTQSKSKSNINNKKAEIQIVRDHTGACLPANDFMFASTFFHVNMQT